MKKENRSGRGGAQFIKTLTKATVIIVAGLIAFSLTLFHLIPAEIYGAWISGRLNRAGLSFEAADFSTGFPFGFKFIGFKLKDHGGRTLLSLDDFRADLNPLGLLSGIRIDLKGSADEGTLSGIARAGLFGVSMDLEARGIGFERIEALEAAGIKLNGSFDAVLALKMRNGCPKGSFKMQGVELKESEVRFKGMPLPTGSIEEAGASAEFSDCRVRLDGLWIEGKDLSARLQGVITLATPLSESPVELTLELVPRGELLKKEYLLSLLSSYKKSANYYSVPVKGTLGSLSSGL